MWFLYNTQNKKEIDKQTWYYGSCLTI